MLHKENPKRTFNKWAITAALVFGAAQTASAQDAGQGQVDPLELQHDMALTYFESGDFSKAVPMTIDGAKQGHPASQMLLATMYKDGKGVEQSYTEAKVWYEQAAKKNHVLAQFHLGVMYEQGIGGPQDFTQALKWYGAAGEQGLNYAQFNLGMMYLKGHGTQSNITVAQRWFEKSCANGIDMGCEAAETLSGFGSTTVTDNTL